MEISLLQLENGETQFSLVAPLTDLVPFYKKTLLETQRNAELKGFRKGKAPIQMIEKLYKGQIDVDSQVDYVNEKFAEYTKEKNLPVLSQPTLKDIKKNTEDNTISFVITFETLSAFDLPDYKDLRVYEPTHAVNDEEIENEIYRLVRANGTFEDAEMVTDYDYVVGINVVDTEHADDSHVPEEQNSNVYLNDEKVDPELKTLLLNAKVGDVFDYKSQHGDHSHNFKVTVTDIQKLIPAEYNNEFVVKVTDGKFASTEELRENIGYDLQELWDKKSRQYMELQIIDQLISRVEMQIPESLIHRTAIDVFNQEYKDRGLNFNKLDKQMQQMVIYMNSQKAQNYITWNRLRDALIEKEGIIVEDYDIQNTVNEVIQQTNQSEDKIREILLSDENYTYDVKAKKLMDLLFDFAITDEITFEEYEKMMNEKNEENGSINQMANLGGLVDMSDNLDELGFGDDDNSELNENSDEVETTDSESK